MRECGSRGRVDEISACYQVQNCACLEEGQRGPEQRRAASVTYLRHQRAVMPCCAGPATTGELSAPRRSPARAHAPGPADVGKSRTGAPRRGVA